LRESTYIIATGKRDLLSAILQQLFLRVAK